MAYIDNVTNILQIQPDGLPTFVRLSQNENGRNLYFQLAGNEIDIPANATITISGTKPDGTVYSGTGSISDNVILIPEMIQMTAVAGYWDAKVKIISGGNTIATGRIRFVIDADTVDPDSVPSDSELEGLVAEAQQYAETARTEAYGSPLTAQTAAGMTDHTRVYVYTGSESGYTAGHWYFWNGSAWTDGGIYNSVAVNTDTTLTLSGVAADAKATGDAIEAAESAVEDYYDSIMGNIASTAYGPLDTVPFEAGTAYDYTGISVGSTMPATPSSVTGWSSCQYECQAGDLFIVTARGGSNMRTWGFTDTDRKLLSVAASNTPDLIAKRLYAPSDGYFYVNNANAFENPQVIHKRSFSDTYPDIMDAIEVTGDELAGVKEDLSYSGLDISGNKIYLATHRGKCFNASGSEYSHIDINAPTINNQWNAYLIPSTANDVFTIFAVGGLTVYAYAFIDSNGDILRRSARNYTANGLEITAPENTAYLVVNDKGGESRVYSGQLLIKDIDDIKAQITALNKYSDVTFYVGNGGIVTWSSYAESPVEYHIGNNNYIIGVKGITSTITPQQIETAATNAGLTVANNVITGTNYAILFDPNTKELNVITSPLTNANISKTTSMVILFLCHFKSIRMGKVVDYMTLKRLEDVEEEAEENAANIDAVKNVIGSDVVPTYFESNLTAKIPEIINNMNEAGQDGTTFVFITDIHWETNYKNSPALVKRVLDKTSVKNVFCGGDIINEGEKDVMAETFLDCINSFRFVPNLGFFPIARGNHDDNSNWSSSADVTNYAFDGNTIYNLLYSQFADRVTRIGSNWAFYFDQEATKTRYIFVDTKRNGLVIDYSAIINCLNTVNANWHVVFLMHFTLRNATTLFDGCSLLGHVVKAYNNRQSGSYKGAYQTATYDFTDANGTVDLIIGGHMHADYAMDADDANNPAGVPIVATDTDSYRNHTGTEGTVDSQCFDVVTINYVAKTIKCVRIGRGADRNFTY